MEHFTKHIVVRSVLSIFDINVYLAIDKYIFVTRVCEQILSWKLYLRMARYLQQIINKLLSSIYIYIYECLITTDVYYIEFSEIVQNEESGCLSSFYDFNYYIF